VPLYHLHPLLNGVVSSVKAATISCQSHFPHPLDDPINGHAAATLVSYAVAETCVFQLFPAPLVYKPR
jgi:hypothetical protein